MLTIDQLLGFLRLNNIPLRAVQDWKKEDIRKLYLNAARYGYSFSQFINNCVVNETRSGIATNFDDEKSLYETYLCFSTYSNIKC